MVTQKEQTRKPRKKPEALTLSSQFLHCPMFLSVDPYAGCGSQCRYCFAGVIYDRQNKASPRKKKIVPTNLSKWKRVLAGEKIGNPTIEYLVSKRHPIQLGTKSDPFPYGVEEKFQNARKFLEICNETQYPVYITTKNTDNLPVDVLSKGNYMLAVSLSSHRESDTIMLERNTLSPQARLDHIPKGIFRKVILRWQPFIPQLFSAPSGSSDLLDWSEIDTFLDIVEPYVQGLSLTFMNWGAVPDLTLRKEIGPDFQQQDEVEILSYIRREAHKRKLEFNTANYRALSDSPICCGIKRDEFDIATPWVWGNLIDKLFTGEKEYLSTDDLEKAFPEDLKEEMYASLDIPPFSRWAKYSAKKTSILDEYKKNFTFNRKMNPANFFAGLYSKVVDGEFRIYFKEYRPDREVETELNC